ncbi:hypothetical protein MLD38_001062 [Melastoma candidum]|uniref:Uncharacterized protein n=1 Tax=Melastoma candidum TaxID=119954 RepID=A0ACB9SFY9_9MYRT|nr:hypothetical protein MLD38_001062 [Melastoma candidum]
MVTQSQAPPQQNYDRHHSMEKIQKQKEIDDWLPITSARNAKWWYSTFHNVTAMVGAGVLGLPYAMSELGWGPGVAILVLSWVITLYTLWQMVEMHEMVPGRRFDRYTSWGSTHLERSSDLHRGSTTTGRGSRSQHCYMVTGGKSLQKFLKLVCSSCKPLKTTYFIMIFASVHFVLSPAQLQLHLWRILGGCRHVVELLDHRLGGFSG